MPMVYPPPNTREPSRSVSKDSQDTQDTVAHNPPEQEEPAGANDRVVYSSYTFKTADLKKIVTNISGCKFPLLRCNLTTNLLADSSNNVKALESILKPHHVTLTQASTISLDSGRDEQALYLAAPTEEQINAAVAKLGLMGAPGRPKSVFRSTSRELLVTPSQDRYRGKQPMYSSNLRLPNPYLPAAKKTSPQNLMHAKYSPISEREWEQMEKEFVAKSRQASAEKERFDASLKHTIEVLKSESRERASTIATTTTPRGHGQSEVEGVRHVSSPPKFSPPGLVNQSETGNAAPQVHSAQPKVRVGISPLRI